MINNKNHMNFLVILSLSLFIFSCAHKETDKVHEEITNYIESKVKKPDTYKAIRFYGVDTVFSEEYENEYLKSYKPDYKYSVLHVYEIQNDMNEKVMMSVKFRLDSFLHIIKTVPESLNGNYGSLSGNIFWKYNDYVGNKPDGGSTVTAYCIDTTRTDLKYSTACDVAGNFRFDKVLPGNYLLIVNSANTTASPKQIIQSVRYYGSDIKTIFNYEFTNINKEDMMKYTELDSLYTQALINTDRNDLTGSIAKYRDIEYDENKVAGKIISQIPNYLRDKLNISESYSRKIYLKNIVVSDGQNTNTIIDFGNTYY